MIQLNPPIPMSCPKGNGLAVLVIDYGLDHDLMWVIALDDSGECWTYSNPEIRFRENVSYGRKIK